MNKDEILSAIAVLILLFTALIGWNIYSWLILVGTIAIIFSWYFRETDESQLIKRI